MPQPYTPAGSGVRYQIPMYEEAADGVAAFKAYSDSIDYAFVPPGVVAPYIGTTPPGGWLLCNGGTASRDLNPKLAAICGTTFGTAPDGFFRLPNLQGRFVAGVDPGDTSGDFATVGKTGGSKSTTLKSTNLPSHDHTVPKHSHTAFGEGKASFTSGEQADHTHANAKAADGGAHQHDTRVNDPVAFSTGSGSNASRSSFTDNNTNNLTAQGGSHNHTVTMDPAGKHQHATEVDFSKGQVKVNDSADGKTGTTGTSEAFLTLGPYMALNWIVRGG